MINSKNIMTLGCFQTAISVFSALSIALFDLTNLRVPPVFDQFLMMVGVITGSLGPFGISKAVLSNYKCTAFMRNFFVISAGLIGMISFMALASAGRSITVLHRIEYYLLCVAMCIVFGFLISAVIKFCEKISDR